MDVGNSTTGFASLEDKQIENITYNKTSELVSKPPLSHLSEFRHLVISSVVPAMDQLIDAHPSASFVTFENIPILKTDVPDPRQIGADRLVNALAAFTQTKTDTLIVDSGTALTFCFVSKEGVYQGGSIVPGMNIASKALHLYTAKIPPIFVSQQDHFIGKTTIDAVQSGLYFGYQHLINGFIAQYRTEFPDLKVIGTGTGLDVIKSHLDLDLFDATLIFKGLQIIAEEWQLS